MKKLKWWAALSTALALAAAAAIFTYRSGPSEPGNPATPGVTAHEVVLGSSLALGGHASFLGTETLRGALTYIKETNRQGGVHGRAIRVIAYDDGYDPARCLANTLKLVSQDRVFSLFSYVGTPTTLNVLPVINEARVPLLGAFTGAHALREPVQRYVINVRASYYKETASMVRYLVEYLNLSKVAVFYQYDSYGLDGLTGTELALSRHNLKPVATGSFVRGTMDVEEGLSRIQASGAQAVIMVGTYDPCAKFIRLAKERGFNPIFLNVSFVGPDQLAQRLGPLGDGVVVTQVVPPPTETLLLPGAREYVDLLGRYFPGKRPTYVGFEGYLNAKVLVEGLRRAGPNLTREGFVRAIESIRDYSLGIASTLNYSPTDHAGLERVYLTVIEGGRLMLLTSGQQVSHRCQVECLEKPSRPTAAKTRPN